MPYHLQDHIYLTQFQEDFIILDTKQDNYTICFKQVSEVLIDLLECKSNPLPSDFKAREKANSQQISSFSDLQTSIEDQVIINKLIDNKIIEKNDEIYPFYIDRKPHCNGISNVEWRLPLASKKMSFSVQVLKALSTLLKVNFNIKIRGLYSTIWLIKKFRKNLVNCVIPQDEDLKNLAYIVNKACIIYPTRTKCLEWAMTFVLLALERGWKCNLEIGVQNYPFLAHAWVECDGKVVMDSPDLRDGLAIILSEPFRKLRK
jgi:hypothetical protein